MESNNVNIVTQTEGIYRHTWPTLKDWESGPGLARMLEFANVYVQRHHSNKAVKFARQVVGKVAEALAELPEDDKKRTARIAECTALVKSVDSGKVLNLLDYVPDKEVSRSRWEILAEKVGKLMRAGKTDPKKVEEAKKLMGALTPDERKEYAAFVNPMGL